MFVAEDGPHIVGRLSLSRDPHPASRHVADLGLMVAESHRRQGVGTMLLEQAVAWAREVSVRKLELHVFPWNEPALGLYTSFGFEREGYRRSTSVAASSSTRCSWRTFSGETSSGARAGASAATAQTEALHALV